MNLDVISKYPVENQQPTPLLFIHGALHGAWCWDARFLDFFAQRGYASHAVNLRGHGKSEGRAGLRWTRIADFVDDVAQTVEQLPNPPILIGHSMGGFIIQKYLEGHTAPAAVLLSSPFGLLPVALKTARRHPLVFAKLSLTLSLYPLVATPALAREAFFSDDLPEDELRAYWEQMQDDAYLAYLDMVALDRPKPEKVTTPMLVLGAGRDNMLSPRDIEATARAYNTHAEIIPDVAHDSMLDPRWQSVAERILVWLNEQPVASTSADVAKPAHAMSA